MGGRATRVQWSWVDGDEDCGACGPSFSTLLLSIAVDTGDDDTAKSVISKTDLTCIRFDVPRMTRSLSKADAEVVLPVLERVLIASAIRCPDVGYRSQHSLIAAECIQICGVAHEGDAFWLLQRLLSLAVQKVRSVHAHT
jgi:hypothetical protein